MLPKTLIRNVPTQLVPPYNVLPLVTQPHNAPVKIDLTATLQYQKSPKFHNFAALKTDGHLPNKAFIDQQQHSQHKKNNTAGKIHQTQQQTMLSVRTPRISPTHNGQSQAASLKTSNFQQHLNTYPKTPIHLVETSTDPSDLQQQKYKAQLHQFNQQKMETTSCIGAEVTYPINIGLSSNGVFKENSSQQTHHQSNKSYQTISPPVGVYPKTTPFLQQSYQTNLEPTTPYYQHTVGSYQQQLRDIAIQSKRDAHFKALFQQGFPVQMQSNQPIVISNLSYTPQSTNFPNSTIYNGYPLGEAFRSVHHQQLRLPPQQNYSPTAPFFGHPLCHSTPSTSPTQMASVQQEFSPNSNNRNQTTSVAPPTKELFRPYALPDKHIGSTKKRKRDEMIPSGNSPKLFALEQIPQSRNLTISCLPPYPPINFQTYDRQFYTRILQEQLRAFEVLRQPIFQMASQKMQNRLTLQNRKHNTL